MKNSRFTQIFSDAAVELGAWILSGSFFIGMAWLVAVVF